MLDVHYLVASTALAWLTIVSAALIRTRAWAGLGVALGTRDTLPSPTPLSHRADRAAANAIENTLLFVTLVVAARLAGAAPEDVARGAAVFFWARVAFTVVLLAGVKVVRTVVWGASVVGLGMIAVAALRAA